MNSAYGFLIYVKKQIHKEVKIVEIAGLNAVRIEIFDKYDSIYIITAI